MKKKKGWKIALIIAALIIILAVAGIFLYYWWIQSRLVKEPETKKVLSQEKKDKTVNFLLLGRDTEKGGRNADTIFVLISNFSKNRAAMLFIPKDTRVSIPGYGSGKAGSSLSLGGAELTIKTISEFFKTEINHYILVEIDGFKNIVDSLGGINVEIESGYPYLPEGKHHLNGNQVLQYLRWQGPEGDIGRIKRQQKILTLVAKQFTGLEGILKNTSTLNLISENVSTDLSLTSLIDFAKDFQDVKNENLLIETVPGQWVIISQEKYWKADEEEMAKVLDKLKKFCQEK